MGTPAARPTTAAPAESLRHPLKVYPLKRTEIIVSRVCREDRTGASHILTFAEFPLLAQFSSSR